MEAVIDAAAEMEAADNSRLGGMGAGLLNYASHSNIVGDLRAYCFCLYIYNYGTI